jgi:SOS response associated peptidase (SRAP)
MTTNANHPLSLIQERMPVIIERKDWKIWLGEEEGEVTALLRPLPSDRLRIWPVDRKVNNVKKRRAGAAGAAQRAGRGAGAALAERSGFGRDLRRAGYLIGWACASPFRQNRNPRTVIR